MTERSLQLLSAAILGLLLLSIAFTLTTVWTRAAARRRERRWAELESRWEPLIHAVLAGDRPPHDLHARVARRDTRHLIDFLTRYARHLRGAERGAVVTLAEPYLDAIARDLLHGSPERRARALQTLGELGERKYEARMLEALSDPSSLVAMAAARALARNYHGTYADRLLGAMERFDLWSIPLLLNLLGSMGSESAGALRRVFSDEARPPRTRAVAALTLASLNDLPAAEIAARVARTETQIDLVLGALAVIGAVGGPEQLPCVRELLRAAEPAIRGGAVRALAKMGESEDVALLRAALDDDSSWVVLHAARSLSELGRTDVLVEVASADHHRALAREMLWEGSP